MTINPCQSVNNAFILIAHPASIILYQLNKRLGSFARQIFVFLSSSLCVPHTIEEGGWPIIYNIRYRAGWVVHYLSGSDHVRNSGKLTWSTCEESGPEPKKTFLNQSPGLESGLIQKASFAPKLLSPEPKKTLLNQPPGLENGPEPKKSPLNQSPGLESGLVQKACPVKFL